MEFFLKQHSTEPILKMRLVEDGRHDINEFYDRLQNSTITFSMRDQSGIYKIYKKPCGLISRIPTSEINRDVLFIYYKWDLEDTDEKGIFEGEFIIKFYDTHANYESTLIAPIREKLYVNII